MKAILEKLKESIELEENLIQFRIGDEFYEMTRSKKGDWSLFTVFGRDLRVDLKKFKGLEKPEAEELLKQRFRNIEIY